MNEASLLLHAAVVMKYSEDSLCLHERENLVVLAQSLSIPGHDMQDMASVGMLQDSTPSAMQAKEKHEGPDRQPLAPGS